MSQSDAFLGILRVFFQIAAPSTTSGVSASNAETRDFFYSSNGLVYMKLESTEHLDEGLRRPLIKPPHGSNYYVLHDISEHHILIAFALRQMPVLSNILQSIGKSRISPGLMCGLNGLPNYYTASGIQ
eukprot:5907432-Pleurochrysis_carterae.AAC.1